MNLLVVGAGGLLGSNVVAQAIASGHDVVGTYHTTEPALDISLHQLDLRKSDRFGTLLDQTAPDAVINCAAMTDVDGCEEAPEQAHAVNAEAPGHLASMCAETDVAFVQVSTDYVFDGEAKTPYDETATPAPIQVYGTSKLEGERLVRDAHDGACIVRLSFVYGIHRGSGSLTGFPAWVHGMLTDGEQTPLFTDQHVTPSRAGQTAKTILSLIEQNASGLYHVASQSCVTPYEFGDEIRTRMGVSSSLLVEGTFADVERAAARPQYTCLDVGRIEGALGRQQPTLTTDLDPISEVLV